MRVAAVLPAVLVVALSPLTAGAAEFSVDSARSELVVRLFKGGLAAAMAHNHVIRATDFEGRVIWNPEQPDSSAVEIHVYASSLVVDEAFLREKFGLEKKVPEDKLRKVQATMESPEQLDVRQYPSMSFRSTAVARAEGDAIQIAGELSLHGITRSVTFTTKPQVDGDVLTADAAITFLQSHFGIRPYSAALGMVKNKDEARLIIHLEAIRSNTGAEVGSATN